MRCPAIVIALLLLLANISSGQNAKKWPIPSTQAQAKIESLLQELYKEDLVKAEKDPLVRGRLAQTLLFEDAAYVFKWGLRGVWGISNRVNYEAPRDEIDRMWLVTPRKK